MEGAVAVRTLMHLSVRSLSALALLATCSFGCASSNTAARAPEPTPERTAKAEPAAAPETKEAPADQEKVAASSGEADPRADGLRKPSRPPNDLITGPNLVYMFNFKESEVGRQAREKCQADFGESPRDVAACMEKARGKVPVESVRFLKDKSGQHWWVTYNRYKGNLLKWHKVMYMPGEETDDKITLKLLGKDEGIAPMPKVPRSLLVELPNDYTIVLNDPDLGPMTYDAKIGTMED
jgi:hypothetical protein